jgi:hypothetical protein
MWMRRRFAGRRTRLIEIAWVKYFTSLLDFAGRDSNEDERAGQEAVGADGWFGVRPEGAENGRQKNVPAAVVLVLNVQPAMPSSPLSPRA